MQIVHGPLREPSIERERILLRAERSQLARRRWRGTAEDGAEFGFDLDRPLGDGAVFHAAGRAIYALEQLPEAVLVIPIDHEAARIGWSVGNLHFPIAIEDETLLVPDDPAVRQLCEREAIPFSTGKRVFRPLSGAHSHGHAH